MNEQERKTPETMEQESDMTDTAAPDIAEVGEPNEPPVEEKIVPVTEEETSATAEEPLPVAPEQPEAEEPAAEPESVTTPPTEEPEPNSVIEPVEHSAKYEKVLKFYRSGSWNERQVVNAVVKCWITPAEFTEITGMEY